MPPCYCCSRASLWFSLQQSSMFLWALAETSGFLPQRLGWFTLSVSAYWSLASGTLSHLAAPWVELPSPLVSNRNSGHEQYSGPCWMYSDPTFHKVCSGRRSWSTPLLLLLFFFAFPPSWLKSRLASHPSEGNLVFSFCWPMVFPLFTTESRDQI